jgi:DNA-binding CsgD family transcriptional regulator
MFEAQAQAQAQFASPTPWPAVFGVGPGPASLGGSFVHCITSVLDEVDYGMVLVNAELKVLHMNHAARIELDGSHPLQLLHGALYAPAAEDRAPLLEALASVQRGLRSQIRLGQGASRVCISVVPLLDNRGHQDAAAPPVTLLLLGKRRGCSHLAIQGYASSLGLTPCETQVLELLVEGLKPGQIAQKKAVRLSTVRSQVNAIRAKANVSSVNALVQQVAALPPMVGVLRMQPPAAIQ